jgi:hypothetical protein
MELSRMLASRPHPKSILAALFAAVAVSACGGGGGGGSDPASSPASAAPTPAPPPPAAGSVTLTWEGPTTNADSVNSPLADLAGYRVYMSTTAGSYGSIPASTVNASAPGATQQSTIASLAAGRYYFVVTASDTSGNESVVSNEISVVIP